jgi:hypothetical protein
MLTAPGSSSAQAALVRAAAQLERDLADRNVLCSKIVGEACVVTTFNTICSNHLSATICACESI